MEQLLQLAFQHPRHRDARPLGHDLGHVLGVDLLLEHPLAALVVGQAGFLGLELLLEGGQDAVAQLRRLVEVAGPSGLLGLEARPLDLLLELLDLVEGRLLLLPLRLHGRGLLP